MDEVEPHITLVPNGPYLVEGLPLERRAAVNDDDGRPVSWTTTGTIAVESSYALCRCGGSSNKPFCDSSHRTNGFDGSETTPETTYDERARVMPAVGMVVRDDRSICEHAGFCATQTTNAWKMVHATEDAEVRARLMTMVEMCPSGALTYRLTDEGDDVEKESAAIGVVADGPLAVTGRVRVTRSDGVEVERRARMTLCRCGHSSNKPLCDGTHATIGFADS